MKNPEKRPFSWGMYFLGLFTLRGGLTGLLFGFVFGIPAVLVFGDVFLLDAEAVGQAIVIVGLVIGWQVGLYNWVTDPDPIKCPDCLSMVRAGARVCKKCGYEFDVEPTTSASKDQSPPLGSTRTIWRCSECQAQVPRSYDECPKCGHARIDEPMVAWSAKG